MNSQLFKNLILWLVIFVAIIALYQLVHTPRSNYIEIPYSEFIKNVDKGDIKGVEFRDEEIRGEYTAAQSVEGSQGFKTYGPASDELIKNI